MLDAQLPFCTLFAHPNHRAVSTSMVLLNKSVLSSFDFNTPIAMLLIQCTFCALFAFLSQAAGLTRLEPPSARLISAMIPINVLFVGEITFFLLPSLSEFGGALFRDFLNDIKAMLVLVCRFFSFPLGVQVTGNFPASSNISTPEINLSLDFPFIFLFHSHRRYDRHVVSCATRPRRCHGNGA